jgi:hypothetical protein
MQVVNSKRGAVYLRSAQKPDSSGFSRHGLITVRRHFLRHELLGAGILFVKHSCVKGKNSGSLAKFTRESSRATRRSLKSSATPPLASRNQVHPPDEVFFRKLGAPALPALRFSSCLLRCQTIETGSIVCDHLGNLVLRNPDKVFGNLLARVRERPLGVRIVGAPHQTPHTDQFPGENPRTIVFEGRPELALKIKLGASSTLGSIQ